MNWYEIYAHDGHEVPTVMLVRPVANGFEVIDPGQQNRRVFEASTHEEVRNWLNEDEFEFIARKQIDS